MPDDELLLRRLIGGDPGVAAEVLQRAEDQRRLCGAVVVTALTLVVPLTLHRTEGTTA